MDWTLVTGGAKGLGAQICLTLAELGLPILLHYRSSEAEAANVIEACRQLGVEAEKIQGDFSTETSTQEFVGRLQRFHVSNLINNVGNYLIKSALETSEEEWKDLFQINFQAPLALIRSLISSIKEAQGSIVNIGVAGLNTIRADTYCTAYSMSKLSLWMLTKSLAKELASSLVRVNMVSPGHMENSVDLPDLFSLPMKRPVSLKEVAGVVLFLLAKENRDVTGQNIEVAGGQRL